MKLETEREDLPLPSPRYLEIHAAACRVAHMAGAADYYRKLEDADPYVARFRSMDPVSRELEQLSLDE